MDMDFECLKNLTPLLNNKAIFGYQDKNNSIANAFMISPPKHPLFKKIIYFLNKYKHLYVLDATGPGLLTKMINNYQRRCNKLNTFPRRILLSFAPVSSQKNIEFLKWLGVEIPYNTERYLQGRPGSMKERSLDVAIEVLNEILTDIEENDLRVPVGLNVEHILSLIHI